MLLEVVLGSLYGFEDRSCGQECVFEHAAAAEYCTRCISEMSCTCTVDRNPTVDVSSQMRLFKIKTIELYSFYPCDCDYSL